jgi:hypothetical protein
MKDYNHIFILYFQGNDDAPRENAEALVAKAALLRMLDRTTIIQLNEPESSATWNLSKYKDKAKGKVCVYVVGHGTETSESVGHCTAKDLATTLDTISDHKLTRVSFVACHAGGDGKSHAPHRFVTDFWDHAKHFVEEVTGYTGAVHLNFVRYRTTGKMPEDAVAYKSWSGQQWWVAKGTGRKTVSHDHDEDADRRKIYISAKGGTTVRSWTGKL